MDAITLLRDDHKTVEKLFKQFDKAGDRAFVEKRRITDGIIEELSAHAAIEEDIFYPVVRATVPDLDDTVLEGQEEHHVVKWLLSELADLDPEHERFDAKAAVLIETVRRHVEEEESEVFSKVRSEIRRSDLVDLGELMVEAKKVAPTRPHPRLPESGTGLPVIGSVAGVVDRVTDNVSGLAQGSVSAVQDLIARITGRDAPKVSPTGSRAARSTTHSVRRGAGTAADGVEETIRSIRSGAEDTAAAASAGAKSTATTAKTSTASTKSSAKRAATTTGRTARSAASKTSSTAKRAASKTAKASSRG
ncbi:MAG: hemerythrin domain-containing protein [Acidimicrobiales bacterium]